MQDIKFTVGQALHYLRRNNSIELQELARILKISHSTYRKIERDQRDLSFIMALRVCQYFDMDIHQFISLLADHELERPDLSSIKDQIRKDNKRVNCKRYLTVKA